MNLDKEKLVNMYNTMVRIRKFDECALEHYLAGEMSGFLHLYIGEEAIATGVCANLTNKDQIVSTHRGHGHCIAKGGDINLMMAELYGKVGGYCYGKGGSMHIADRGLGILGANGIVGAGSPIAVGAAFAQRYLKTNDVTVVFFGDGASNRGTQHEAMNMASIWSLPVVFVVENNGFGLYTAQKNHQNITDISARAVSYGMKGVTGDGNDLLAVYEITKEAIDACRKGNGPVLLEFKTWRHYGHFVGDAGLYKDPKEQEYWVTERDPIASFGKYLVEQGMVGQDDLDKIDKKQKEEVDAAVEFAKASPFPEIGTMLEGTYKEG